MPLVTSCFLFLLLLFFFYSSFFLCLLNCEKPDATESYYRRYCRPSLRLAGQSFKCHSFFSVFPFAMHEAKLNSFFYFDLQVSCTCIIEKTCFLDGYKHKTHTCEEI